MRFALRAQSARRGRLPAYGENGDRDALQSARCNISELHVACLVSEWVSVLRPAGCRGHNSLQLRDRKSLFCSGGAA
jgi:hypothetical protein